MRGGKNNATVLQAAADSDEEEEETPPVFKPLDGTFSYSATPKALEVVPTKDIKLFTRGDSNRVRFRFRNDYGSPVDNSINTRHVSGKKIDKKHAQYALSAGMMLGVRECVGGMTDITAEDQPKSLTLEEECSRVEKFKFPAGAYFVSSKMASLPYRYKFKAYAPKIFHRIRDMAGVDKQLFLHSICGSDAFIEFVSNAKSGQFFFYSHDGRYMIKTQTQDEKTFLRQILPHYYNHLKNNPHSFITHFYGMYRVKIPDLGKSVHFVIMKSVFNTELEIHKIWDLKGSTLGRRAKRGDSVHKDLDILDEGRKICVGKEKKDLTMKILKKDADFLAKMHIMDYSILLGVHLLTSNNNSNANSSSLPKQGMLTRTNTPMRRKKLFERNGDESVMQHFLTSARTIFHNKGEESTTASDTTSNVTNSYEDDSDDSDREETEPEPNRAVELNKALSFFDINAYHANVPPNPYSKREDFGIESGSGSDIKEVYFGGEYFAT
jgi:1-phosphatidylinositol-4-phosphate 5-kinase